MKINELLQGINEAENFSKRNFFDQMKYSDDHSSQIHKASRLVKYMQKYAHDYMSKSRNGLDHFYHGIYESSIELFDAFIQDVNHNRQPRDSKLNIHTELNYLIELFGYTAHRGNSIFVISNEDIAQNYVTNVGSLTEDRDNVYIIIPLGNMFYTWSPQFEDWQAFGNQAHGSLTYLLAHTLFKFQSYTNIEYSIGNEREATTIIDSLLPEAVNGDLNAIETLEIIVEKIPADTRSRYILGDDDTLSRVSNTSYEVMFHCDKFLAIHCDLFNNYVLPLLKRI